MMLSTSSAKTSEVPLQQKIHDNLHDAVKVLDVSLVKKWIGEGASPRECESFHCKFSIISEAFDFPYTDCNRKKQIEILKHILEKESSHQSSDGYKIVNQCIASGNSRIFGELKASIVNNMNNMKRYHVVPMIKHLTNQLEKNGQNKSAQEIQKCFDLILSHLYRTLRPDICFLPKEEIEIEESLEPLASTVWRPFILSRIADEKDIKFRRAVIDRDIESITTCIWEKIDVNKYFPFNGLDPHRALSLAVFRYNHRRISMLEESQQIKKQYGVQYEAAKILLEAGAKTDDYKYILNAIDSNNLPLIRLLFDYKAPVSFSAVISSILYDFWEKDASKNIYEICYGKKWESLSISEIKNNLCSIFDAIQYSPKQIKKLESLAMILVLLARKSYGVLIILFKEACKTPEKRNFFEQLLFKTTYKEINKINKDNGFTIEQTNLINKIIVHQFDEKTRSQLYLVNKKNILTCLQSSLKLDDGSIMRKCFEFIDQTYGCKIISSEEEFSLQINKAALSLQEEDRNSLMMCICSPLFQKKLSIEFAEDFFDPVFLYKPEKLKFIYDRLSLLLEVLFFHKSNPENSLNTLKRFILKGYKEEKLLELILQIPSVVAILDEKASLILLNLLQPSKIHAVIKAFPSERAEQIFKKTYVNFDPFSEKKISSRELCGFLNSFFNTIVLGSSTLWSFTTDYFNGLCNKSSLIEDKNSFENIFYNINAISFMEMALIFNNFHGPFPYSAQNTLKFLFFFNEQQLIATIPLFDKEFFLSVIQLEKNFSKKIHYLRYTREEQRIYLLDQNVLLPDCYHNLENTKIAFINAISEIEGKNPSNERDEKILSLRKNFEQESYKLINNDFTERELQQIFEVLCFKECSPTLAQKIEEKKKEYITFFENISKEIAILRSKIDSLSRL